MDNVLENISQQDLVFTEIIRHYLANHRLVEILHPICGRRFKSIVLTGMGTSYFGSYPAYLYLLNRGCQPVHWLDASELLHYGLAIIDPDTLLILVSQSGESYEIVKILQILQEKKIAPTIIGVTMTEQASSLRQQADMALAIGETAESSLGAFKSYTGSVLLLLLLAKLLIDPQHDFSRDQDTMAQSAATIREGWPNWQESLRPKNALACQSLYHISRGPAFSASMTGALIAIELAKCNGCAISGGQFRHGPIESAVNPGNHYLIAAPAGATQPLLIRLAQDLAAA